MYLRIRNRLESIPEWVEMFAVFVLFLGGLFAATYVWAVYEWAGVSGGLFFALFVMFAKLESEKGRTEHFRQFIWNSELRYDYYPVIARPSEEQLLAIRRSRIESDPELLAQERRAQGLPHNGADD